MGATPEASKINAYVNSLGHGMISSGPDRSRAWYERQIEIQKKKLPQANTPIAKVKILQKIMDHEAKLGRVSDDTLRTGFIEVALAYSKTHGISAAAWREMGVPASVLKEAGF